MTGSMTETGRLLRDDPRQHGSACDPEQRRPDWCPCGQTENILAIERESAARSASRPHRAVRPGTYPSQAWLRDNDWPSDPPFCVECGAEMLTVGDLEQAVDDDGNRPEWHAIDALNLASDHPRESDHE